MESTQVKVSKGVAVKWVFSIILPLLFFLIPVGEIYTLNMRNFFIVTVFCLCLIAFELIDTFIVAALMPALWILFNVAPAAVALSAWTSTTLYMCMGSFMLAAVLEDCGLLKRISYMIMTKTGSSYMALLFCIFLAGLILSIITFGGAYIVMGALCYGLCRSLDLLGTRMAAAIAMVCMIATSAVKSFTYCATIYGIVGGMVAQVIPGFTVTFIQPMIHNFPMLLVCLFSVFVIAKWYKADREIQSREYFVGMLRDMGPMSRKERVNLGLLVVIVVVLLSNPIHGIPVDYALMILPWLAFLPIINGATEKTLELLNWKMVFFIAGCMGIGNVATNLGFDAVITTYCVPWFQMFNSSLWFFFIIFMLVFVFNFLMTPVAIWVLVTQPLLQISMALNIPSLPLVYALIASAEAVILPYEYVSYLAVYAFGMISMGDFIKLSIVRCIIFFAGFMFILVPYWMLIGIL